MDNSVEVVVISAIASVITLLIGKFISSRMEQAQAQSNEGDAAESLSNAAKTQVEVYQREIITPMQHRIEELVSQLSIMEEDRFQSSVRTQADLSTMRQQIDKLTSQVNFMKGELFRADTSLEYITSVAKQSYPNEVDKAIRIRRGQE